LRDTQYKYDTNITRTCQMLTSPVAREVCTMQEPICTAPQYCVEEFLKVKSLKYCAYY